MPPASAAWLPGQRRGAIRAHLNDHEGGLADMRRNVDAWFPLLERGEIEGLVMNASGCGVTVKEYGRAGATTRPMPTRRGA